MARALKTARYSRSVQTFTNVFRERQSDLGLIAWLLVLMLVLSSSSIYFAEHAAQPGTFSSIPAAMWWSIVTLTTVGYGDLAPATVLGKLLASALMILGYGIIAVPTGIVTLELDRASRRSAAPRPCPGCGVDRHDPDARYCRYCGSPL
jgi:voltage-gated potassium channel